MMNIAIFAKRYLNDFTMSHLRTKAYLIIIVLCSVAVMSQD